ncbi:SDR family NAD(P)-dependent oxidoreductase, partial [Streptomyces inhibens]
MDLGLTDRTYIVTGATRGLGFATARELVADGANVVISGRTEESAAAAAASLGARAHGVAADNADADAADRLVAAA